MRKLFVTGGFVVLAFVLILASCSSDKNSTEACRYETTLNLDKGNYDAVLASSCADFMQLGAAWFGKAGFDIKNVLNGFIDANSNSGSGTTKSDLNIYMTSLTGNIKSSTLTNLDNARSQYGMLVSTDEGYKDSQFYISLVDAVKGLSIIKLVIQDPNGSIDSSCNLNGNTSADGIDATACALKVSVNQTCDSIASSPTITYTTVSGLTINKLDGTPYAMTFTALNILTGPTGSNSATCGQYTKILYPDVASPSGLSVATTTQDKCTGSSLNPFDAEGKWPCPIEDPNYLNFVSAIDSSISSAISGMDSSLSSSSTGSTPDVQQSVNDIKAQHCCTDAGEVWNPSNPASCTCSPAEMAAYLQTI